MSNFKCDNIHFRYIRNMFEELCRLDAHLRNCFRWATRVDFKLVSDYSRYGGGRIEIKRFDDASLQHMLEMNTIIDMDVCAYISLFNLLLTALAFGYDDPRRINF